jgi:hypothetical protein
MHVVKKAAVCAFGNEIPNCQQVYKVLQNLEELSQNGTQAEVA